MEKPKIGITEKIGFSLFSISVNIVTQFVNTFILFFYTDVFGISPALAGGIISFGLIWDGVNDPLIASYADNHRFRNGERVRPYQLYTSIPLAIVTVLMFTTFPFSQSAKAVYAVAAYVVFYTLTTFLRLPAYAMPALATPDIRDRLSINTFVSGGASLGGVLASLMCWPLVRGFAGLDSSGNMINPQAGFIFGSAVVGAIIIFGSLFSYFTTKERIRPEVDLSQKISIFKSFSILIHNYNWRWNTLFSTLYFINNVLLTTTLVYYCQYVIADPGKTTLIMAMFALGSLIALPFVKKVDLRLGRRKTMMIGAGFTLIAKIPFLLAPRVAAAMMVYALIMGISVAINIVVFSTTRAEVSDIIEKQLGRRIDSMVTNLMGFINKCGTSLTTLVIGIVLEVSGYVGTQTVQPPQVSTAIIAIMGWAALAMAALMVFCASKITIEKEVAKMKEESHV